ncbi:MAG: ribosome biogenesis GTPase Der [Deltaproteobacteria bacterium]|nr:ribosome biogenesis GTPase Der [Deltaproteobacteria bacterium]
MSPARLPTVAIVGRPNVGKSSLFNALIRRRAAIVDATRGVTRDRIYGQAQVAGARFNLVDTGGFEVDADDPIFAAMRDQAQLAIDEADAVIFAVDCRDGLLPADREIADLLRRGGRPCVLAVNKVDGDRQVGLAGEFYELGFARTIMVSALNRLGLAEIGSAVLGSLPIELQEAALAAAPAGVASGRRSTAPDLLELAERAQSETEGEQATAVDWPTEVAVAVVGRPNVGKSSLINCLLGEKRLLVSEVPGTTRDAVDTLVEHGGRRYRLVDTAGLRRKRSIALRLDRYSVVASLNAIDRADAVVLVVDGAQPLADQDLKVAATAERAGKALVLVANKMDLVEAGDRPAAEVLRELRQGLPFVDFAPLCRTSALTGHRVFDILQAIDTVIAQHFRRIPTSAVNRVLHEMMVEQPPPVVGRGRAKFFFGAQVAVAPPTFVVVCRRPDGIPQAYRRFVERRLRDAFGFAGVPLVVAFRSRERQRERSALHRRRGIGKSPAGEDGPDR